MSMAPRDPKWSSDSLSCAGQAAFVQRRTTSPSGRDALEPQTGHRSGEDEGNGVGRAAIQQDLDDVRDHVAGPLDDDGVALADVQALDLVGVVQRRAVDGHPGDAHRREHAPRGSARRSGRR